MLHISTGIWDAFRANPCDATFDPIYQMTSGQVYTICRRMLRNPEDAMDAMQASYARLLIYARDAAERHNASDPHADFGLDVECILRRFTIREADNLRKRRGRRGRKEIAVETIAYMPDSKDSPRRLAEQEQVRCKLEALVDQLGEEYRLPVLLHFFDGMTHAEIADTLDVPRSTITQRLGRAIRRLQPLARRAGLGQSAAALAFVAGGASLLSPPTASARVFAGAQNTAEQFAAQAAAKTGAAGFKLFGLSGTKLAAAGALSLLALCGAAFAMRAKGHKPQNNPESDETTAWVNPALQPADNVDMSVPRPAEKADFEKR